MSRVFQNIAGQFHPDHHPSILLLQVLFITTHYKLCSCFGKSGLKWENSQKRETAENENRRFWGHCPRSRILCHLWDIVSPLLTATQFPKPHFRDFGEPWSPLNFWASHFLAPLLKSFSWPALPYFHLHTKKTLNEYGRIKTLGCLISLKPKCLIHRKMINWMDFF